MPKDSGEEAAEVVVEHGVASGDRAATGHYFNIIEPNSAALTGSPTHAGRHPRPGTVDRSGAAQLTLVCA